VVSLIAAAAALAEIHEMLREPPRQKPRRH
jgi:hypothetical protein